jgi:urease accessory protein
MRRKPVFISGMQLSRSHLHSLRWLPLMALACAPAAHAHHLPPGFEEVDEFATHGAARALLHPFTGIDHILVALGVGWMAWTLGRRMGGGLIAAFLGSLVLGVLAGSGGASVAMDGALALALTGVGFFLVPGSRAVNGLRFAAAVGAGVVLGLCHARVGPASLSASAWACALAAGTAGLCVAGYVLAEPASKRMASAGRWVSASLVVAGAMQWLAW